MYRFTICNTQQRQDRTCIDHIQWAGTVPCWGMGPPTHHKNFNPEWFLSKENSGTKSRVESEGKAIQRPPHLVIHLICRHQTQTLLLMPRSACLQQPGIAVSWEALPEPNQYRWRCSQPTIGPSTGTPMEELAEGLKERKGLIWHQWEGRPLVLWRLNASV